MGAEQIPEKTKGVHFVRFAQRGSSHPEKVYVFNPDDIPGLNRSIIVASNVKGVLSTEDLAAIAHDVTLCMRDFLERRGEEIDENAGLAFEVDVLP